ncbi:hypothetical protein [Paraferrimonas sedimenticola]|uniref:Uncharacterized protein n=1 Tax=Paraferrimonas sedimenticola TaxID=375674 RepID=A0AA37RWV8_9GAMM|nr:hypothetical protein [Paraferrimonas sedimenticola]GLP96541.1 hypothetical protein GCM10007895_18470 [Paraferrimonas sedimenticola]
MHKCHGRWELVPELSFYQKGEGPVSGEYHIQLEGEEVSFTILWQGPDGKQNQIQFGGLADGEARDMDIPPGAKVSYTVINEQVLDSEVFLAEQSVAYARRQVSNSGDLMSVLQVSPGPDGEAVRVTQVYRRVE